MLLHILHRTHFAYSGVVRDNFNEVRLEPVDNARQACRNFQLRIAPAPNSVRRFGDYYGNRVHYFDVVTPHSELVIEAESEVETRAEPIGTPESLGGVEMYAEYLTDTPLVPLADPAWRDTSWFRSGAPQSADFWAEAVRIGEYIHAHFRYEPNATAVNTPAVDVLRLRAGVCQDFAHVMLGLCRLAGIPARYVSGYFLNLTRRPGEMEASHAWVEVHVPSLGWVAYDPTHGRAADERYVQIAAGRDYGDIRPIAGTFRGLGTKEMRVEVCVREMSAAN